MTAPNPYQSPATPSEPDAEPAALFHDELPPWRTADLPEPLPFSFLNAMRTIGPGAILLAAAMGGGEWIVGPLMAVKYGSTILWIATTGIIIQSLFNLEAVRYTLYTGEPIITGIMRLRPGPKFWAPFYLLIGAAQLATPALAVGAATVLITAYTGDKPDLEPGAEPRPDYSWATGPVAMVIILITVVLLQSGKSIERVLEKASWMMVAFIFTFLIAVNVLFVPASVWKTTLSGFAVPHELPEGVDIVLLALFAATAGSGGLGNLTISNWFRDKGFGMGRYMGGFGSALRDGHEELASVGSVFPVTPKNLDRWQSWWRYAIADQTVLWAMGCFLGMFLNVNLVLHIVGGAEVSESTLGAFQAKFLARFWQPLWWLALINGFWILYSTHMGNTDCLVRTSADILWSASPQVQKWSASKLYAALLLILTVWALLAANFGSVLSLFKVLGIVANPIMAIAAVQILRVNTRFLPKEIQPPYWRQAGLVICALFYGGLTAALFWSMVTPKS